MARSLWAGAWGLALILVPVMTYAKDSAATPQPSPAPTVAAKATAVASPQASPQPSPQATPSAQAKPVSGTAHAQAVSATAASTSTTAKADHKSYALAELLSVVPGVVVHGSGHMYAGAWMKGLGLFALEGASSYVAYDSIRRGSDTFNTLFNGNTVPTNLTGAYSDAGVALVAGMAFFWTWWDDIAGSGIAVEQYNKRQDEAAGLGSVHMQLMPAPGGAMLALNRRF